MTEALNAVRMEHVAGRAPYQLSMGECRRVAIATVLAMRPAVLALDEPSARTHTFLAYSVTVALSRSATVAASR